MIRILFFTLILAGVALATPDISLAQNGCWTNPNTTGCSTDYIPMVDWPGVTETGGFASYAVAIYSVAIVVAALLAVVRLVIAGVKYMTTDVVSSKGEARNDIIGSLLGLLIIISAVIILNTINPNLTTISIVTPIASGPITGLSNDDLITWSQTPSSLACSGPGLQCVTSECPAWRRLTVTFSCSNWCDGLGGELSGSLAGNTFRNWTGIGSGPTSGVHCTYAVDPTEPNSTEQAELIADTLAIIEDPSTVIEPATGINPATDRLLYCGTSHDNTAACASVASQCTGGSILPGGAGGSVEQVNVTRTIERRIFADEQIFQTFIVCRP